MSSRSRISKHKGPKTGSILGIFKKCKESPYDFGKVFQRGTGGGSMLEGVWVPGGAGVCRPRDVKDSGRCLSSHNGTLKISPGVQASHLKAEV